MEKGCHVVKLNETASVVVEQIQEEITVVLASTITAHFEVTADQALQLSRALANAAANAQAVRPSNDG